LVGARRIKVAIVGAGIVGASIARVLSRFEGLEVHLVEKEVDVGWGVSKANSGIIHAGYDDEAELYPNRARLCVEGNVLWHRWVEELSIPVRWCGSIVVALNRKETKFLEELLERGVKNQVPTTLRIVDREELKALEPHFSDEALAGLWSPSAGHMSPWDAVLALVENAVSNGVKLHLATEVIGAKVRQSRVIGLETTGGFIEADWVVNAAGLYADRMTKMVGLDSYAIRPRRGEYMIFDKNAEPKVSHILFSTPTPTSKGVVVTTTVDGNLMIGPNAQDLRSEQREDRATTCEGLDYVWKSASRLLSRLPPRNKVIRFFSGLRPEPSGGDFILRRYDDLGGFIEASGMRSPGLTSAPAIAHQVLKLLEDEEDESFESKDRWSPYYKPIVRFSPLPIEEKEALIRGNPSYGRVICEEELVTEAEIVEAVKRGATTIDGVKFRTRALMGVCQGSQCMHKIALIMARELGIPLWKVTLRGPGTEIGLGDVKVLLRKEVRHP